MHTNFYTSLLKTELHPIYQGNLSLTCTILKGLHNPQDYTFKICKKKHQHSRIP